jgi:hypothetical protein
MPGYGVKTFEEVGQPLLEDDTMCDAQLNARILQCQLPRRLSDAA